MGQNLVRGASPAMLTTVAGPFFFPVIMVYLDWPGAPVRVHSGRGDIPFDGETWRGVGAFGEISLPEEGMSMASVSAELRLVGLGPKLDDYLDDEIRGRASQVLFSCVTERAGNVLVADPVEVFSGYMDGLRDIVTGSDGVLQRGVSLTVAQGPSQRSSAASHHTAEDQAQAFPADTAGRHTINAEARAGNFIW